MASGAGSGTDTGRAMAVHWRMPQAMGSLLEFWDKAYPLRMYNSLTRSKVRCWPAGDR
jgi:hypothetical protein